MMLSEFTFASLQDLPQSIYLMDSYVRRDLAQGMIADERDYVSSLTNYIRLYLRQNLISNYCISRVLKRSEETKFGCDAMIVIRFEERAKICLFEAKYPRMAQPNYPWDSKQKNRKKERRQKETLFSMEGSGDSSDDSDPSHFSNQLERQAQWASEAAIWEMFIIEAIPETQHSVFDNYGSTCIWHDYAYEYEQKFIESNIWTQEDLRKLLSDRPSNLRSKHSINLRRILRDVLQCKYGKPLPLSRGSVLLTPDDDEREPVRIPASFEMIEEVLPSFLDGNGLSNFIFIDLDN